MQLFLWIRLCSFLWIQLSYRFSSGAVSYGLGCKLQLQLVMDLIRFAGMSTGTHWIRKDKKKAFIISELNLYVAKFVTRKMEQNDEYLVSCSVYGACSLLIEHYYFFVRVCCLIISFLPRLSLKYFRQIINFKAIIKAIGFLKRFLSIF